MVSLDGSFVGYIDGKLDKLLLGDSIGSTDGKLLGTILVYVYVITLGIEVVTDLGSLDGSFDNIHRLICWMQPC